LTGARAAALGALAVAVIVVAAVLLTGGGGHTYKLNFQNAGQLVKDDDVQIGGRRVGSVRKIELTEDNQAQIEIKVDEPYAPLHMGTTAAIRATSLSGIANRYIALTPAPNKGNPKLDDGAVLAADKTTSPVDLDQLFNTLDPKTRRSLQLVIKGQAAYYQGRGPEFNDAAKYYNPTISTSARLVREVNRDQQAFEDLVIYGAKVTTALASRRDDLADLVTNTNTTAAAIGSESDALSEALSLLPTTLRRGNTTFVNLRATLTDLDRLTDASLPATKRLAPFFRALRPLVRDARPTIHDLRLLVTRPGKNNDLIELLQKAPTLERLAGPTFKHSIAALRKTTPVVSFIRPYTPDLVGWIRDFGQGSANYDANGHYARIQPIFNAFSFTSNPAGGTLRAIPGSQRFEGLQSGNLERCPGAASQPPADGSAPYRDSDGTLDCDPSQVLPGP
jgi:phospholipid/cholesterol/gamma-HCH transport system substrate-binding protein